MESFIFISSSKSATNVSLINVQSTSIFLKYYSEKLDSTYLIYVSWNNFSPLGLDWYILLSQKIYF